VEGEDILVGLPAWADPVPDGLYGSSVV